MENNVSLQTLTRMPIYLEYLKALNAREAYVSARAIGGALSLGEIQVRKDLAAVSSGGRPRLGYRTTDLIRDIENYLGCNDVNDAVLVGAGKLGRALMGYQGFKQYGLNIVAAFDKDPAALDADESGRPVFPVEHLGPYCRGHGIRIGILTVPAAQAQSACDRLVESGVLAIWNFAPKHLTAPEGILIKSENMAASLALLSRHLRDATRE